MNKFTREEPPLQCAPVGKEVHVAGEAVARENRAKAVRDTKVVRARPSFSVVRTLESGKCIR